MALVVTWTPQAKKGLQNTLDYLEENWTSHEILQLEHKLDRVLLHIVDEPLMYPESILVQPLRKARVDKNNYLIYKVDLFNKRLIVIDFRSTRSIPLY